MKRFIPLILLFASSAFGQTVVNGTCSITVPATSLPSGMTLVNGLFTVPNISTGSITLTGGVSYPNGNYLVTITGGNLTYTPYVPSTGTGTAGATYTVAIPALGAYGVGFYPVNNAAGTQVTITAGQTYSISPVFTGNPQTALPGMYSYVVPTLLPSSTGLLWLRIVNGNGSTLAAASWTASVH
jgi:hypothetical protein